MTQTIRDNAFELVGSETVWTGFLTLRRNRYRYPDGQEAEREVVAHPGAVAVVAHDDEHVFLVRQPREAVGETDLVEIPAGLRDRPGEPPLDCAKRELVEEIGKTAGSWEHLTSLYTSPGCIQERVDIFLARDLTDCEAQPEPDERIEIVPWPLAELHEAIAQCRDAKSLSALLLLSRRLNLR